MIQTAIEIGIRKINVATEIRMAYVEGLLSGSANGDYYEMVKAGKENQRQGAPSLRSTCSCVNKLPSSAAALTPCAPPPPYKGPSRFKRTVLFLRSRQAARHRRGIYFHWGRHRIEQKQKGAHVL